jgi:hypothetical protein
VIECMVRNTPLIVNRLAGVEELLGKDYPGFYSNLKEAACLASNIKTIVDIHSYLKQLDKSRLTIGRFVRDIYNGLLKSVSS